MPPQQPLKFVEIDPQEDAEAVRSFLSHHLWPFHGRSTLSIEQARQVKLGPPEEIRCFWVTEQGATAGLVRIFDLEDCEHGSVQFDLRLKEECRGRGIGRATVAWLINWLFAEYPRLFRIEAATRIDNLAMRRVLALNHFVLEGQLRQTWRSEDGTRYDTALYGRLRGDG